MIKNNQKWLKANKNDQKQPKMTKNNIKMNQIWLDYSTEIISLKSINNNKNPCEKAANCLLTIRRALVTPLNDSDYEGTQYLS